MLAAGIPSGSCAGRWYGPPIGSTSIREHEIPGGVVRVWKPVAFAVTFGLALPAVSSAATLNVAPGACLTMRAALRAARLSLGVRSTV
jgi:hypothetical protein